MSAIRLGLILLPAVIGWLLGAYLDLRAVQHLRSARTADKVAAFMLGPLSGVRFRLEGFRYRGLGLACRFGGIVLTAVCAAAFGPWR